MASRDIEFDVSENRLDGPYDTPDSFAWELYDSDGDLVDGPKTATDISSSVLRNGRLSFLIRCFVDEEGLDAGKYSLEITHNGNFLYSADVVLDDEPEYVSDDHFTLNDDGGIELTAHQELGDNARWRLFYGNNLLANGTASPGDLLSVNLVEHGMSIGLTAGMLLVEGSEGFTQHNVWLVTPSILRALRDLRVYLDRLNRDVRLDGLKFGDADYMHWLEMGRDKFNALVFTDFTMTDATGPIRSLWLVCSQHEALRTRYLEEGLTSFSYNGAAVTLDVDTASVLDSHAGNLESHIQDQATRLKTNLGQKGLVAGPGSWAVDAADTIVTGKSISPVTGHGGRLLGHGSYSFYGGRTRRRRA